MNFPDNVSAKHKPNVLFYLLSLPLALIGIALVGTAAAELFQPDLSPYDDPA